MAVSHVSRSQVLAGSVWPGELVLTAIIPIATQATLSASVSGANGHGCVMASISDGKTQGTTEQENVVVIVLVDP
jgi:hypothetical protein